MSVRRRCERLELQMVLQKKVQNIALGCMTLHVIGFTAEIIQASSTKYYVTEKDQKLFEKRAVLSIITESMVGMITSILLYCGARRKNKYMLVPFMIVMMLLQAFLVITLFLFATLCISGECINGDPLIYFYLALLFILISITCWLLRTTKSLFDELRKDDAVGSPADTHDESGDFETQNHTRQPSSVSLPNIHRSHLDIEANNSNLHVSLPITSGHNSNQESRQSDIREEPPPNYNVAMTMTNSTFERTELPPPPYEDVMKKEQTVFSRGTNDLV